MIHIFDTKTGQIESCTRDPADPMPGNIGGTLTVGEFLGANTVGWTDTATMEAWNVFREACGAPVHVDEAFRRLGDRPGPQTPQFYAGTAFSVGSNLDAAGRAALQKAAAACGAWSVVDPLGADAATVHFDKRWLPSGRYAGAGLPNLFRGTRGSYVFLLQDILTALGCAPGRLDGKFGNTTDAAVRRFQKERLLAEDGVVTRMEWESLLAAIR